MKINFLKINGFGKIKNKEINLNNEINLIYGKNESGKSTLLKFIYCMLYGASKNKNGKEISDYEKYKPWNLNDFSGKIKYTLDNEEQYEVFREFSKKNPKIYNKNLEDISKEFNVDKNKGNQFFYDQTKIDEALFLSTNIVEQQQVVLDNNNQNLLTQKIANILSSGEGNISYKKVMGNLSKKLIEDVGTDRTTGRPLNETIEKIKELKKQKEELDIFINSNKYIKNSKKEIDEQIIYIEKEIDLLKQIKEFKEIEEKEKEKININEKIVKDYNEKIELLNNKKIKEKNNNKKNKRNLLNIIFITILIALNISINFTNLNIKIKNIIIYFSVTYLFINLIIFINNKKKNKKMEKNARIEKIKISKEIEVLEEQKTQTKKEIEKIIKKINTINEEAINNLKNKFDNYFNKEEINNLININIENIYKKIEELNKENNNKKIQINTLNIKEIELNNKLEDKIKCEEQLKYYEEQKEELLSLEESINIAKEALEEAYNEMKNEVTPKFTKNLSLLIEKISNRKYNKANFDSEYGLTVERETGEYIECSKLSIGTIDQLYLSLRLSAMNEISEEKMPIIMDEAFAYYDNERLENILKYINQNYKENQVLIFTCSNREKDIMDKLNINYNLVNLENE